MPKTSKGNQVNTELRTPVKLRKLDDLNKYMVLSYIYLQKENATLKSLLFATRLSELDLKIILRELGRNKDIRETYKKAGKEWGTCGALRLSSKGEQYLFTHTEHMISMVNAILDVAKTRSNG